MFNQWLNKHQAKASGKPCFIPRQIQIDGNWIWDGKWAGAPPPVCDILLTYTRCQQLECPVGPKERPAAYVYKQSEPSKFRYVPFWARFAEQINLDMADEVEARIISRRRGDGVRNIMGG
ncbi:hypothetical protein [Paenibacillus lutimineralis]|uniref:Uncharacterized protein n=1 Tax=Paenibacillus lutimineralis TaxID=2707005 RepID=A0A3S9V4E6_9BACL|nr:hypothetical protein [Paenibacillus lutimineralis]AZS17410.1 hypothetical protein EI981_25295 [Paenibacillus lutimineralis]